MKKRLMQLILIQLLLLSTSSVFAWQWTDLWQTADQQGTRLLQAGNAKQAAQVFKNKDWQAVAKYRAGDYEQALQRFKSQNTSDGQYNAGNAAAYLGRYQEAIAAYDKAIALNPHNKDAITNREIIKKLFDKQNNSSCSKNSSDSSAKNEKENAKDSSTKNDGENAKNSSTKNDKKDGKDSSAKNEKDNSNNETKNSQNSTSKDNSNPQQSSNNATTSQANGSDPQKTPKSLDSKQDKLSASAAQRQEEAKEEDQKQLLRRLSDDPGGLLRQKFLRDYFRRHSDAGEN